MATISIFFILLICGVVVNTMSALFGVGGGVLLVPILRTLFPLLPIQVIAACSLTIVMCIATINLILFRRQSIKINQKNLIFWSIGIIIGVQIGFELSFFFSDKLITAIFIITLILLGLRTFLYKKEMQETEQGTQSEILSGMLYCGFGGFIAGVTGIGGGSIMAPLVAQLKSVNTKQIAVYTNYMMVFGGVGNLYGYLSRQSNLAVSYLSNWQFGYVNFAIVGTVVIGALASVYFSMKLRNLISDRIMTKLLGLILFTIACYMGIWQYFFAT